MNLQELKALIPPGPYTAPQSELRHNVLLGGVKRVLTIYPPDPEHQGFVALCSSVSRQLLGYITREGIVTPGDGGARAMLDLLESIEVPEEAEWNDDPFEM